MIGTALKWLTDPAAIGRKRTVAAIAAVLAGALRGASLALHTACEAADIVGAICRLNTDSIASYLDTLVQWLNVYVVPGADAVTLIMGIWGLWAARGKKAVVVASMLILALILPSQALAQEPKEVSPFEYALAHAYFSSGTLVVDGESHAVVEVRFVDDFRLASKLRGAARVSLFTLTRAGEQAPAPTIPTTLQEAKAYSDGEVWLALYREIKPWLALECASGLSFKMTSLAGTVGDPLDGTKVGAGCGPRLAYQRNHVSILAGHYGQVVDRGKVVGFVPSVLVHAFIPLTFLGKNTAFTPDLAVGATLPSATDPDQRRDMTKSLRLLVSTRF